MTLSVLLPCRDVAATVSDAARSVLAESCVGELLCVDDGSTDATRAALLAIDDPRVRVISAGGVGIARALALGLRAASGDWIGRMDGDDVSLPGRFAASLDLLGRTGVAVAGVRVSAPGAGPGMERFVAWQNGLVTPADHAREIFVEAPVCHPATTFARGPLEEVGGWIEREWTEDYDLWLRLVARGHRIAKVPHVLFEWTHREGRATFHSAACAPEALNRARARYLRPRLGDRSFAIWGAGKTGRRLARALEAEGARPDAFVDIDPAKVGRRARGVPIEAAARPARFTVVAVGAAGARDVVRGRLAGWGLVEGADFLCAA